MARDDSQQAALVDADDSTPPASNDAPNWAEIDFDVICSRCGYDLRMLSTPRCPECGLQFTWHDVLDDARWKSDFLFEHHWRKRPVGSWLATMTLSLRPFRFWSRVSIHHRLHTRVLWLLLISSPLLYFAVLFAIGLPTGLLIQAIGRWGSVSKLEWLGWELWQFPLNNWRSATSAPHYWALIALPVPGALGVLCGLRQTLSRCRIRTAHMLRIVAYASGPVMMTWALLVLADVVIGQLVDPPRLWPLLMYAWAIPLIVHMSAGLRRYARLPRPVWLALVAAAIGVLVALVASTLLWIRQFP